MSKASNLKYLKSLVSKISDIPKKYAIEVAYEIYMGALDVSLQDPGFDSGQAAANWRIESYVGSPSYEAMRVMWGYGDVKPVFPVGYKSYYQTDTGRWVWNTAPTESSQAFEGGNPDIIHLKMGEYATIQVLQMPKDFTGITVYNPVESNAPGLGPGDTSNYEQNALSHVKSKLGEITQKALAKAEATMRANHGDVLK